jgi:hypothetical protein
VRNLARDWLAERRRVAPSPIDPRAHRVPGAGELVTAAEEAAMTRRAFESLPGRWRAVLWQTEVEGRTPGELAQVSGMTPNAVAQLAARARIGLALAWHRERGTQERITGPAPALVRLAERKYRKTLDTSQADSLDCDYSKRNGPEGRHPMYAGEYYADGDNYYPGSDDDELSPFDQAMSQLAVQAARIAQFEQGN